MKERLKHPVGKVLLYSGGMDSWLINKIWKPDAVVYVDIHGAYSEAEKARLPKGAIVVNMPFLGEVEMDGGFVPLRNLYFLMIASHFGDDVCLGATAGDGGVDKSPEFLDRSDEMIDWLWSDKKSYREHPVHVEMGFVRMSKGQLIRAYLDMGGTVEEIKRETFSCYTPGSDGMEECMGCYPCFRKYALLRSFGATYSREEMESIWKYVEAQVIPTREEGGYDGTYYTDRGDESIYLVKAVDELKEMFG